MIIGEEISYVLTEKLTGMLIVICAELERFLIKQLEKNHHEIQSDQGLISIANDCRLHKLVSERASVEITRLYLFRNRVAHPNTNERLSIRDLNAMVDRGIDVYASISQP